MRGVPCIASPTVLLVTLALALLAGCSDPDPTGLQYANRRAFEPDLELYLPWWEALEECTGLVGDLDGIRWYLADWISGGRLGTSTGQWLPSREITFRRGYQARRQVVQHHMLHDILRTASHDDPAWDTCVDE